jgi:hypothetical protein
VWHTPAFKTLLNHDSADVIGRFQLGEGKCALRVLARHDAPLEERTFTVTMIQVGGGREEAVLYGSFQPAMSGFSAAARLRPQSGRSPLRPRLPVHASLSTPPSAPHPPRAQRQGGPYDGYWLTESVICDSVSWDDPSVIISW